MLTARVFGLRTAILGLLLVMGCRYRSSSHQSSSNDAAPSCKELKATCGPSGNDDCCKSLLVPGGTFKRGYDGVVYKEADYPATVSDFYLDKYEITLGRFRAFVSAGLGTQKRPPAEGSGAHRKVPGSGWRSPWNAYLAANTDALMAFPYKEGDTRITAKGRKILNLPAQAPNMHWTRSLVASPQGLLYVGVGSNSNIGENDLETEDNRAAVLEVNPKTGAYRIYAAGLRNPVGLAFEPKSGALWGVVNERDMLGSDLVPDYLTRVEFGAFYGWPWNYWGGYEDRRVQPQRPEIREYTKRPDYALGNHVAPLGLSFADKITLGAPYANGAFVGLHGSWNRKPAAGYKVVFVPFADNGEVGKAKPIDVLTGFLGTKGEAHGRPVDVTADAKGALLVSDDVGGVIWRVTPAS